MDFKPTAGEIANIWTFIVSNEAQLCLLEHWLYHAEDKELKELLQRSKNVANQIIEQGKALYLKAGFPEPIGYSLDKDVVPDAPRLMTDKLVLVMLQILSEYGVYGYGLAFGKITTPQVLSYLEDCLNKAVELYKLNTEINAKKGYNATPIFIPRPNKSEYVQEKSFLAGWFGEQRPLNALEIDGLLFSLRGVMLAKIFLMAFSQIAKDPELKQFCRRGKQLTGKRVERLQSLNATEDLSFQPTYETEVTNSTVSPFSDKLIMFEALSITQVAIARYGNALSSVVRRDLGTLFAKYIIETGTYLDDGLKISIDKQWFEQPPLAADRKKLSE